MAAEGLSSRFYFLRYFPDFPEVDSLGSSLIVTRFLVSVSDFSIEGLFSLTVTAGDRWRFSWGVANGDAGDACLTLCDRFVFFVALW